MEVSEKWEFNLRKEQRKRKVARAGAAQKESGKKLTEAIRQ